jgi:hypothetical protein
VSDGPGRGDRPAPTTWTGDLAGFAAWARDVMDLGQFGAGLESVPPDSWPAVAERLTVVLAAEDGEPTAGQLRVGTDLTERLRTPAALLRRQIRLEKVRLVRERQPAR